MIQFDRNTIGRQAKELGFVRDTFEKVCRLADVLKFFESDDILSSCLALKGGTGRGNPSFCVNLKIHSKMII